jgi:methanogenic corrinoid protein MtbC1
MSKADIMEKLRKAVIDLDDEEVNRLLEEGLKMKVTPMELITEGLSPSVNLIGELYEKKERFMSDLIAMRQRD